MRKVNFLVSVAVLAMAAPAWAQETPKPADEAGAEDPTEIVVTATKRSESLSNVPIAISAVSGETLQNTGATDIRAIGQVAPSLLVSGATSEVSFAARIRGVGTVGENPGLESSVGLFVDGVYRSRTGVGLSELGDIERVEVLRGPQGTLFGKNSTAGLINVVTKGPSRNFEAKGSASYGNYDYYRIDGSVTGPLTQTLSGKLDAVYINRDGFTKNLTPGLKASNDRDRYLIRGQLLFEPSSDLSVRLIGDYTHRNEICCAAPIQQPIRTITRPGGVITIANNNAILDALNQLGANIQVGDPFNRSVATTPGFNYLSRTRDYGFSGEVNYNLGGIKLTSITAYRDYKNRQGQDQDFTALDILHRTALDREFKLFTEELRLQGKLFNDRIDWLIGGYASDERLSVRDNAQFGADADRALNCIVVARGLVGGTVDTTQPNCATAGSTTFPGFQSLAAAFGVSPLAGTGVVNADFRQTSKTYAFFTHNVIQIVPDKISLTLGGRYTNERKSLAATLNNNNNLCGALRRQTTGNLAALNGLAGFACAINSDAINVARTDPGARRSDREFTGTAVLSYKPFKDLLLYGSYSRGFKAGGFNLDSTSFDAPCNPAAGSATTQAACTAAQNNPANTRGNARAEASDLQFGAEKVDAYEVGLKYKRPGFSVNISGFLDYFYNFQLNTFNGINFEVANITSCKANLNGADTDNSSATGACAGKLRAGVLSKGVELESFYSPFEGLTLNLGFTYSDTKYRRNLTSTGGSALSNVLFQLPGRQISNAPRYVATGGIGYAPKIGNTGLTGLLYLDARYQGDTNTGSDLDIEKTQNAFVIVNGRIGVNGPDKKWGVEVFAQNLFNKKYQQTAADGPFLGGGTLRGTQAFGSTTNQLFIAFPAEPRTYGVTVRGKF